jgi:hypothetical protein
MFYYSVLSAVRYVQQVVCICHMYGIANIAAEV